MSTFKVKRAELDSIDGLYRNAMTTVSGAKNKPTSVSWSLWNQSGGSVGTVKAHLNSMQRELNELYDDLRNLKNATGSIYTLAKQADNAASNKFGTDSLFERFVKKILDFLKNIFGYGKDFIETSTRDIISKIAEWKNSDEQEKVTQEESKVETEIIIIDLNGSYPDDSEADDKYWHEIEKVYTDDYNDRKTVEDTTTPLRDYDNSLSYSGVDYSNYKIVSGVRPEFCYNQQNYSKFISPNSGKNVGCTATAIAIAYSIAHGGGLDPTDVPWSSNPSSVGVYNSAWDDYSNVILPMDTYSVSTALKTCYEQLSQGTPLLARVTGSYHHVTIVGVRDGADPNNLSPSDFLIIDPWDGKVKLLSSYGTINTTWSLRVPK